MNKTKVTHNKISCHCCAHLGRRQGSMTGYSSCHSRQGNYTQMVGKNLPERRQAVVSVGSSRLSLHGMETYCPLIYPRLPQENVSVVVTFIERAQVCLGWGNCELMVLTHQRFEITLLKTNTFLQCKCSICTGIQPSVIWKNLVSCILKAFRLLQRIQRQLGVICLEEAVPFPLSEMTFISLFI